MSDIEQEQRPSQEKVLKIEWHTSDNIVSRYANNVLVQAGQYEFTISFFEAQPPVLVGTPEENRAKLEQLESIRAECVGKMIVPPELVQQIIQSLQTTLDNYQATKKQE